MVCALLLVHRPGQVWLIYLVMFCYGAANSLLTATETALLAVIIPAGLLGEADAAISIGITVPQTLSIALGAALITILSYRTLLLIMALSIGTSAPTSAPAASPRPPATPRPPDHSTPETRAPPAQATHTDRTAQPPRVRALCAEIPARLPLPPEMMRPAGVAPNHVKVAPCPEEPSWLNPPTAQPVRLADS